MDMPKKILQKLKHLVRVLLGQDKFIKRDIKLYIKRFGSEYGGWVLSPKLLSTNSQILSFGVGTDISFDLELIRELKMDIEGAKYRVIEDIVKTGIYPQQLLIEFHHRFKNMGIFKTVNAIDLLRKNGYKIFNISESG